MAPAVADRSCADRRRPARESLVGRRRERHLRWTGPLELQHVRDVVVASDPGLDRLRMGLRAVLTAAIAAFALSTLARRMGEPVTVWLLGVSVPMMTAIAVADPEPRAQRRTMLLLPLPCAAAAALAAVSRARPWLAVASSVVVMFAASMGRRFGQRGLAAGLTSFMTFFVALYFRIGASQLAAVAAAFAVGFGVAYLVRFLLVRDAPWRLLPLHVEALRRTIAVVLGRVARAVRARSEPRRERVLARAAERLHDQALALDDLLARARPAPPPAATVEELRTRVFDLQLAAERVVMAARHVARSGALRGPALDAVARALLAARPAVRGQVAARAGVVSALEAAARAAASSPDPTRGALDLRRVRASLTDLVAAAGALPARIPDRGLGAPAAAPGTASPVTRQAVQATLAGGLAMAVGHLVSPVRWYWAVIAAFVLFTRGTSFGDTAVRAWLRVLGTIAGAVAGVFLAHLVGDDRRVQLAALFACIFLAYYLFRVSYAWLIFWITALLAVLYRMVGQSSADVLYLRLEETLVGAAIGAAISALVLPVRTSERVRAEAAAVLHAFARHVTAAVAPRGGDRALLEAARELDGRLRALRTAAQPVLTTMVRVAPRLARLVHGLTALVFYARHLASTAGFEDLDPDARERAREVGARLARAASAAADRLQSSGGEMAVPPPAADLLRPAQAAMATAPGAARARPGAIWLHWLERTDEALSEVAAAVEAAGPASGPRPATLRWRTAHGG